MKHEKRREDMTQQEKVDAAIRAMQIDAGGLNEAPAEPLAAERGRFTTADPEQAKQDARESEERQAIASRGQFTTKGDPIPPLKLDKARADAEAATKAKSASAKAAPAPLAAKPATAAPRLTYADLSVEDKKLYDTGKLRISAGHAEYLANGMWSNTRPKV